MDQKFLIRWLQSIQFIGQDDNGVNLKKMFENAYQADRLLTHYTKVQVSDKFISNQQASQQTYKENWCQLIRWHKIEFPEPSDYVITLDYVLNFLNFIFHKYVYALVDQNMSNIQQFLQNILKQVNIQVENEIGLDDIYQCVVNKPFLPVLVQQLFPDQYVLKHSYKYPKSKQQQMCNLQQNLRILMTQNVTIMLSPQEIITDCSLQHNQFFLALQIFIIMISSITLLENKSSIEQIYKYQKFIDDDEEVVFTSVQHDMPQDGYLLIQYNACVDICTLQITNSGLIINFVTQLEQTQNKDEEIDHLKHLPNTLQLILAQNYIQRPNSIEINSEEIDQIKKISGNQLLISCKYLWFNQFYATNEFVLVFRDNIMCHELGVQLTQLCEQGKQPRKQHLSLQDIQKMNDSLI